MNDIAATESKADTTTNYIVASRLGEKDLSRLLGINNGVQSKKGKCRMQEKSGRRMVYEFETWYILSIPLSPLFWTQHDEENIPELPFIIHMLNRNHAGSTPYLELR